MTSIPEPDPCLACSKQNDCDWLGDRYSAWDLNKHGEPICMLAYLCEKEEVEAR
jgi:hypothetical protein